MAKSGLGHLKLSQLPATYPDEDVWRHVLKQIIRLRP